jgi:hypothetical protein
MQSFVYFVEDFHHETKVHLQCGMRFEQGASRYTPCMRSLQKQEALTRHLHVEPPLCGNERLAAKRVGGFHRPRFARL